jgi:hypothetical protein
VGRGLIENSRVKLTREDVIRLLTPNPEPPMRVEREMVPAVFTQNVARLIDRALAHARVVQDPAKAALLRLLAIRVALLEHPMSQVRKGTIHRLASGEYESITESCVHHYIEGLRLTRPERLWALAQQINAGVFQGEAEVHKASIFDVLPTLTADVAYFDPPYPGVMSYEKEYKVIDEILEGASKPTSPFTARDGAAVIDGLLERAQHIPIWILSLGNAVVTLGDLEKKMTRLGRQTHAFEIKHQHLPSIATEEKKEANREFLVVGWDAAAELLRGRSVGGVEVERDVPHLEVGDIPRQIEMDADGSTAELPTPRPLSDDRSEERESPFAQECVADLGIESIAEAQTRVNMPDAVGDEVTLDRDRELRIPG